MMKGEMMTPTYMEKIETTYKGLDAEGRAYMLALFTSQEILTELGTRIGNYEYSILKTQETASATWIPSQE